MLIVPAQEPPSFLLQKRCDFHIIIISQTTQESLHSDIAQGPLLLTSEEEGG